MNDSTEYIKKAADDAQTPVADSAESSARDDDDRRGQRGGRGRGRGPWEGGPRGSRGGPGPRGERGRHRGRRQGRGDVRAALLVLIAEQPSHGYELMQEIAERTGGVWTPSPGSVYPALQQLQDEGLVSVEANADGRNIASLTAAGETYMGEHGEEMQAAFQAAQDSGSGAQRDNVAQFKGLVRAFKQVLEVGTPAQIVQATAVLEEAQRKLYAVLAQAPTSSPEAD